MKSLILLHRCEIPENTTDQSRMQLLVSWIIENPLTAEEEEVSEALYNIQVITCHKFFGV